MIRAVILTAAVCVSPATAQDAPLKLEPVVSDDFSKDTRAQYTTEGDVSWEPGKLTLAAGASIERTVSGGPWARVTIRPTSLELTAQQPKRELRVWFRMDGATDCYVRLRWTFDGGKTSASVALVDTGEKDGKPIEQVVREADLTPAELRDVHLEYRQGLVRVVVSEADSMTGYISNDSADVRAIALSSEAALSNIDWLAVRAWRPVQKQYTEGEREKLAQAETEYGDFMRLYEQGKLADAASAGERVAAIFKRILGEEHPDYAITLNNLAWMYTRLGNSARAESLYTECIAINRSLLGEQHPRYTTSLNNLAQLYKNRGELARAERIFKQCIETEKSVLGEQHPDYATTLHNLAGLYEKMGDYTRAEPLYRQCIEIEKSALGEKHPDYALSLQNLAGLYKSKGDYARAALLYQECVEIAKSVRGERHPGYATALHNFAGMYSRMGDYARAEPLYEQAMNIRRLALGEQHPAYATSLDDLAGLYEYMGDYARAEPLHKKALAIRKAVLGEQHPEYATSLNNLAGIYRSNGDSARAESLLLQCSEIWKSTLGEQHPSYATSLSNLGVLYESMGKYASAEPLLSQALKIRKSALGEQHPDYATSLNNLAVLYESMEEFDRAESLFRQCVQIDKSMLGEQHPSYATSLHNLAGLYWSMGEHVRAAPLYRQSLDIIRRHLGANASVQSERQQSRNQQISRVYLDARLANSAVSPNPDISALASDLWQWKGALTARQAAYRRVAGNPQLAPLFAQLQSVTQQLSVASGQIPIPPPSSAPVTRLEAFEQERTAWERRFAELTRRREDLEEQIAGGSAAFRHIRKRLTTDIVQSVLPTGTAFIDFIEYTHKTNDPGNRGRMISEQRYLAVVVPSGGEVSLVALGSAKAIGDAITAFRRPMEGQATPAQETAPAAQALSEAVWRPLEKHLDGIETVIISPDTSLGTLPFAALPGKVEGSYLLEEYRFVSLPLAGMLRSLLDEDSPRPQPKKGLLVLGDVDYDANSLVAKAETKQGSRPAWMRRAAPRSDEDGWQSLLGFSEELAIVERAFRKKFDDAAVTTLDGDRATEAEFIKHASNHYNLHLITHGFFADPEFESVGAVNHDEQDRVGSSTRTRLAASQTINQYLPGLLSGVVLAGANNPPPADDPNADGILTASEIETLNLNGVDLVVLSACETGLGKTAGGEGLTGLQRAFHIAGARSCIATLWKVDDKATQEVMSRFYRNYWEKGESKIDALRNAQLEVLRSPRLVRGDVRQLNPTKPGDTPKMRTPPGFWAAFTLSGDWR